MKVSEKFATCCLSWLSLYCHTGTLFIGTGRRISFAKNRCHRMSIMNILSCLVQGAFHFACQLLKCFRAYTISNDCFFSSYFSALKSFPIGFKSGLAKLLQSMKDQVEKIVETLHLFGAF